MSLSSRTVTNFCRLFFGIFTTASFAASPVLVENGQPRAEIVIAEHPLRTVRLAAQELQDDIQKISGAHLPIVTKPSGQAVKIFVGRSPHTDALKVTAEGLHDGAYRIASGDDWLALIGEDTEFTPLPPFARNNGDIPRAQAEWEKLTNSQWGLPNARPVQEPAQAARHDRQARRRHDREE